MFDDTSNAKVQQLNKEAWQMSNLRKLANYLISLPENYEKFQMESIITTNKKTKYYGESPIVSPKGSIKYLSKCGTVACALGHGPSAGIPAKNYKIVVGSWNNAWNNYCKDNFGLSCDDYLYCAWDWCFGSGWAVVDNTPQGAGYRILWFLDKGLPENWRDQEYGRAPLCYWPKDRKLNTKLEA